jgi:hypothetical protein
MPDPIAFGHALKEFFKQDPSKDPITQSPIAKLLVPDPTSKLDMFSTLFAGMPIAKVLKMATGSQLDELIEPLIKRLGPERLAALEHRMRVLGGDNLDEASERAMRARPDANKADEAISFIDDLFDDAARHADTGEVVPFRHPDLADVDEALDVQLAALRSGKDTDELAKFREIYHGKGLPDEAYDELGYVRDDFVIPPRDPAETWYLDNMYELGADVLHNEPWRYGATIPSASTGERLFMENMPGNMTPDVETEFLQRIFEYLRNNPR